MPIAPKVQCPSCHAPLVRKPGGRCPACGTSVAAHVVSERAREERIERVVAVVATVLVLGISLLTFGWSVLEGVLAYAAAGALVWVLARKTFSP